jgi:hypothetical protein
VDLLIRNLPPLTIFYYQGQIVELRRVIIYRNRTRSLSRSNKNKPLPLVLGKTQKVCFSIHLKVHSASKR